MQSDNVDIYYVWIIAHFCDAQHDFKMCMETILENNDKWLK